MTDFEMGFLGLTFLLTLTNSVHLIAKARVAAIEKEILLAKAKVVAEAQSGLDFVNKRLASVEALLSKPASLAASQASSPTSSPSQSAESAVSQPVA